MQRMSDYLHHCGKFVGITNAVFTSDGTEVGDVAVNTTAIAMIREARGGPESAA
jgi:hypothetical protein